MLLEHSAILLTCIKQKLVLKTNFGLFESGPGRVAQSITCLVTDAKLTADPGVVSSIPARSHTFVEIDHEIISTVILLPSAESFMKGCCQLQANVCARLLVNCLFKLAQEKSVVKWTDRPARTIAVDLGRKATNKTNKIFESGCFTQVLLYSSLIFILLTCYTLVVGMHFQCENSVDPDQMAFSEASWYGSTVFSEKKKSRFNNS